MANYNPQPFVSNPMSSFDPTQWSNPYSPIPQGQGFPWPSQYAGPPTDAFGQPIQSYTDANNAAQAQYQQQLAAYNARPAAQPQATPTGTPGTSINSPGMPAAAGAAGQPWNYNTNPTGARPDQPYSSPAAVPASAIGPDQTRYTVFNSQPAQQFNQAAVANDSPDSGGGTGGGYSHGPGGSGNAIGQIASNQYLNNIAAWNPQQPAAPAGPAPPTPPDMSQAYLHAMANPGPLRPVGANVPASMTTTQPGPGVLQQFLANWQPQGGSGPGAGFTQAFSKALRGA